MSEEISKICEDIQPRYSNLSSEIDKSFIKDLKKITSAHGIVVEDNSEGNSSGHPSYMIKTHDGKELGCVKHSSTSITTSVEQEKVRMEQLRKKSSNTFFSIITDGLSLVFVILDKDGIHLVENPDETYQTLALHYDDDLKTIVAVIDSLLKITVAEANRLQRCNLGAIQISE